MTISNKDAAKIAASEHPVYESAIACLPKDKPIPLVEIFAAYTQHSRHLAAVLLVCTSSFEQVIEAVRILPKSNFEEAVSFLAPEERARLLNLLFEYVQRIQSREQLAKLSACVPATWKKAVWNRLDSATQDRLNKLLKKGAK